MTCRSRSDWLAAILSNIFSASRVGRPVCRRACTEHDRAPARCPKGSSGGTFCTRSESRVPDLRAARSAASPRSTRVVGVAYSITEARSESTSLTCRCPSEYRQRDMQPRAGRHRAGRRMQQRVMITRSSSSLIDSSAGSDAVSSESIRSRAVERTARAWDSVRSFPSRVAQCVRGLG